MITSTLTAVPLPRGYRREGARYPEALVRPLSGEDEVFLSESGPSLLPAQKTTTLLARCVEQLVPDLPVSEEIVRSLSIGDREALLLHVRRLTFGDRLQCVLRCPSPRCEEQMDLDLTISELLLPPDPDAQAQYERRVPDSGDDATYCVRFRLPTGADQEAAAALVRDDPQASVNLLVRRCVEAVLTEDQRELSLGEMPTVVAERLPAIMADLDPQAQLILNLTCPECGHAFSTLFDTAAFFFEEVGRRAKRLYHEVHWLAFYYHWSEAEILGLTAQKRRMYLELLDETLTSGGRR